MINPSLLALTTLTTGPTLVVNKKSRYYCGVTTLTTLTTSHARTCEDLIVERDDTGRGGSRVRVSHISVVKVVKVVKPAWLLGSSLTTSDCPVVKVVKIPSTVNSTNLLA